MPDQSGNPASQDFVFVHGGRQGSWVWEQTISAMQLQASDRPFRAITLDVPGCGTKRRRQTTTLDIPDVIKELGAELENFGIQNAVIIGHSQAGTIVPGLLAAKPNMFCRAVYVTCCAPLAGQTIGDMMGAHQHGTDPETVGWPKPLNEAPISEQLSLMFCNDMTSDEKIRFLMKLGKDNWPEACGDSFRAWQYNVEGQTKVSYIVALQDNILPVKWELEFAARYNGDRIVNSDAGHQLMNTRPHTLAEVLLAETKS